MSTVTQEPEIKDYNQLLASQNIQSVSAKEAEKAHFDMPPIAVGDDVEWYRDANRNNRPGLGKVLAVYPRTIDIVLLDMSMGVTARVASRHINDPRLLNQTIRGDSGGWDYAKTTKERMELLNRVQALEAFVAELQGPSKTKTAEKAKAS